MAEAVKIKKSFFIQSREGRLTDYYNVNTKDVLGTGAFASVIKASTKEGGHTRAIKVLRKERINDKDKFKEEIEILKQLDHPNIIKLYETFEDARNVYVVTELCKGGEVFDRITAKGHYTEAEARKIFKEMVHAINYCHNIGICHRDLKPENFLYLDKSDESSIKLIDFGLARSFRDAVSVDGKTKGPMTTRVGTAYYISPEVLAGSYDESCDIWSLGVILYILLSGLPPFNGSTDMKIMERVKAGAYKFDPPEWTHVSDGAKDIIKKMLCKPNVRLSAAGVLDHPWMTKEEPGDNKPLNVNMSALKSFNDAQKLKKIALTVIASRMSEDEIVELHKQFEKLDKNGDGVLTFEEMQSGVAELKDSTAEELIKILESMDTDKSGTINYNEFISATMERNQYLKEEKLVEAFKVFDKDGDGRITAVELKEILERESNFKNNMEFYENMIKEADINGDGVIDYEEFVAMMNDKKF